MIVVSFGSPSAISYAVVDIVRQLLAQGVDAHAVIQVADRAGFEAQRRRAVAAGSGAVLVASDCPQADLVAQFADAGEPVLVCCDAVEDVVRYNMRSRGMTFAPALRFTTQVLSALDGLSGRPHVMRITHRRDRDPLRAVVASIAAFLGIDTTDSQFEAVMRRVSDGMEEARTTFREHVAGRFPHAREDGASLLDASDAALLRDLARCYGPLVEGEPLRAVEWPAALLLDWDEPGRFLVRPVALLGPARFVICGPYLHLPAGPWRVTVRFETSQCFSDNRIEADVFDGRVLAAVALPLPKSGRYAFPMDFEIADPLRPVELRIRLATGAIEGGFTLLSLGLERVARDAALRTPTQAAA